MTAIPNKNILDGSSTPTTAQFKSAMGQLHDFLTERTDVNASASGLTLSNNKRLLGRVTAGSGAIEEIQYSDQGYNVLTGVTALGNPNKIINGAMRIDQRNAGASQTITAGAALAYTVDRFYAFCTGANITGQRVSAAVANTYRYRFTGAASNTGLGFGTRLEAENTAMLAGKSAVLQVKLSSSALTSVTWTAYYAATKDSFGTIASPTRTQIATGSFTINTSESIYSANISVPSAATTGVEIVFTTSALLSGQTLTIGDVQFEEGNTYSAFYNQSYAEELRNCKRYYQFAQFGYSDVITSSNTRYVIETFDEMRTAPTVLETLAVETETNVSSIDLGNITSRGARWNVIPAASGNVFCNRRAKLEAEL